MREAFADAASRVVRPDEAAARDAAAHHDRLTKPRGALGELETVGVRLASIAGAAPPPVPAPAAVAVFAADHGVVVQGVTPWPQEVTGQMVANFVTGGAAINVLARQMEARVVIVDVGVASRVDLPPSAAFVDRRIRAGSALDVGADIAALLVAEGARALVTGEMGIGNTTSAAAVIAALTGAPATTVTGRGTGIDDAMLARKIDIVDAAVRRIPPRADARTVLSEVGGLEIAALAGFIVGGAAARVPVVVDGVIAGAALLAAANLCPDALAYAFAGHRSTEPGAEAVLRATGLRPLLDLDLRLGEGSGACLALPLLEASARVLREMATFDGAGIAEKEQ
jgi:nicotinate-nucleotide--dimethylbenzimidazole phosphoribosyltransferase